ncbi:Uma2 family endonuclease [Spirulina sp. CS-785/01]|uniref:Uma2 family endonuclease n=1 Tax=Spirulina sp. CS-785/01 TaxID=3021716 RepID=UPI00232C9AC5|nr:Uma2 family endonuclease [Spirulina sp. CS-785/01]MDB9315255.1 Uma2 family endonuclease [Spirulina sp. CS-785/01]
MSQVTLNFAPVFQLNREQFYQLCQANPDLQLERTAQGELIIMPPTGGETGRQNAKLNLQISLWNEEQQLGEVFDSSTGFSLPNGSDRSPDVAWIKKSRWQAIPPAEREKLIPLCPDFIIELVSPSDNFQNTQNKMLEYRDNGCLLGWLIDRKRQIVEVYRPNQPVEILEYPQSLPGDPLLPGFTLNLSQFWSN